MPTWSKLATEMGLRQITSQSSRLGGGGRVAAKAQIKKKGPDPVGPRPQLSHLPSGGLVGLD